MEFKNAAFVEQEKKVKRENAFNEARITFVVLKSNCGKINFILFHDAKVFILV
jgi:hypothetical protein